MSNDLRGLLRDAASTPSGGADVAGAWRRGRRMRLQRRVLGGLAIVVVVAGGAVGLAKILPSGHSTSPAGPVTTVAATCSAPSTAIDLPAWTATATEGPESLPHLVSADGNVAAVLFGSPLRAGDPTDRSNKILWIVRQPRDGKPLEITASLPGSDLAPVHITKSADSSPGEIYPSDDNVTAPGCWHFALEWNGHRSSMNLEYVATSSTTSAAPPITPTTLTTSSTPATLTPTTCRTASLGITLSGPIGSAGHFNYEIAFRNNGTTACTTTGFPGVSFLDSSGNQIGSPAQRNPISYATFTLAPGTTGYVHLSITDPSVLSGCPATPVAKVRIFPPNETAQALIGADGISVCATQPSSTIDPVLNHSLG